MPWQNKQYNAMNNCIYLYTYIVVVRRNEKHTIGIFIVIVQHHHYYYMTSSGVIEQWLWLWQWQWLWPRIHALSLPLFCCHRTIFIFDISSDDCIYIYVNPYVSVCLDAWIQSEREIGRRGWWKREMNTTENTHI